MMSNDNMCDACDGKKMVYHELQNGDVYKVACPKCLGYIDCRGVIHKNDVDIREEGDLVLRGIAFARGC